MSLKAKQKTPYRMMAIDLDGTLFDKQGQVSAENVEAVARAEAAGIMTVLCTGRGLAESRPAIEALGPVNPLILATGAHIANPLTGETLHRSGIEAELALDIITRLNNERDAILILLDPEETGYDYLVVGEEKVTPNTKWWFDVIGAKVLYADAITHDDLAHALRVGVVGFASHMEPIAQEINQHFKGHLYSHHFMAVKQDKGENVHVLEIFSDGVNKWTGLQWLARQHDVSPGEIIGIGDEINDIMIMKHVGCSIAMDNAVDEVKALAKYQTVSNEAHGVAHAIGKILDGEW